MNDFTKGPVVNGYGYGVTGPTTPVYIGPTVGEAIEKRAWLDSKDKDPDKQPKPRHTVVSKGMKTIAIVTDMDVGEGVMSANSKLIATAFNAATKCAEMGYDGIACLELLPEAIDSMVVLVEYLEENTGEWDAQQVWAMRAIIDKARGKEAP